MLFFGQEGASRRAGGSGLEIVRKPSNSFTAPGGSGEDGGPTGGGKAASKCGAAKTLQPPSTTTRPPKPRRSGE